MSLSHPALSNSKQLGPVSIEQDKHIARGSVLSLALMAMGVVFGDIGTSPLYAIKICFDPIHGIELNEVSIFGVMSLIFWTLTLVVSVKYMLFVMRADNHGEGGILALLALALKNTKNNSTKAKLLISLGVIGASLFYGESVLTPAISILSAVEGITVASESFSKYIIAATVLIVFLLFLFQEKGTSVVNKLFGPVMLLWFLVIAGMGVHEIFAYPQILMAIHPLYAFEFIHQHKAMAFAASGSIFLVITGAEVLYADMGHFGVKPIRYAWYAFVMPCLVLNYFGQGAMLINHPENIGNPFFAMASENWVFCLVLFSIVATVIASQACISGAYSMTSQGIMLGFIPRMKLVHTSEKKIARIYVPFINWLLCLAVILSILAFQRSDHLAFAYGIAVSITMLMTTFLLAVIMRDVWKWPKGGIAAIVCVFVFLDLSLFLSNTEKILEGGWFPMAIACVIYLMMMTWFQGRNLLREKTIVLGVNIEDFMASLIEHPPHRVEGTAIFFTSHIDFVPPAFLHNLKHNRVLHERILFLKVSVWDVPRVADAQRVSLREIHKNVFLVRAIFGFKETPDISRVMALLKEHHDLSCPLMSCSFFMARDSLIPKEIPQMAMWRESLFIWMFQNSTRASDFFKVDSGRLIELGTKIEL
jgi:KUP system potassium uptake protein